MHLYLNFNSYYSYLTIASISLCALHFVPGYLFPNAEVVSQPDMIHDWHPNGDSPRILVSSRALIYILTGLDLTEAVLEYTTTD